MPEDLLKQVYPISITSLTHYKMFICSCCLMLDAMSIKQQIEFDSRKQTLTGFVDLGTGEESETPATEALVFMLVGLRGHWKAPIAYFFTKGLPAETQTELIKHCLEELHKLGFKVMTLTMDGHASNLGMCRLLGCKLSLDDGWENFKPYFSIHPDEKVYVVLDACHMIKLVRNMLQAYQSIRSDKGVVIWRLISDLHETQMELGLRFANRLSNNHITFQSQKMKVSLAVQTLSSSVASALLTLKELRVPKFIGCDATVEFIQVINIKL
jgi:hypothetical protein